jgi:Serine/threonine protein kinase
MIESVGRYSILAEIGSGESSAVYRAVPSDGGEEVAIKVLHPHLAADPVIRRRFCRELEIARGFAHPNVLPVYELVAEGDLVASVMEYCPGGSLSESDPLGQARLVEVARDVASALAAAHARGIVHRDLRPAKLLLARGGRVKLCDFGSARVANMIGLTRSTMFSGLSEFTPPESLESPYADPRWDLFSFGATLYRLAAGRPHSRSSLADLVSGSRGSAERVETFNPGIESWLGDLIHSLLAPLSERPRSAEAVLAALDRGGGKAESALGGAKRSPSEALGDTEKRKACLFCGASMPFAAPICLACGEEDLIFERYSGWDAQSVIVSMIPENTEVLSRFMRNIRALADDPGLDFDFITEDARLYSSAEKAERVACPFKLMDGLSPQVADRVLDLITVIDGGKSLKASRQLQSKGLRRQRQAAQLYQARGTVVPLIVPRCCPRPSSGELSSYRAAAERAMSLADAEDRRLFASAVSTAASSREPRPSIDALSASIASILSEAASIRRGLESVSLGETYASIRDLDRAIEDSSDAYEIEDLMKRRRELEDLIERYHDEESAYARLVARAAAYRA